LLAETEGFSTDVVVPKVVQWRQLRGAAATREPRPSIAISFVPIGGRDDMSANKNPCRSEFRDQLLGFNKKVQRLEQTRFFKRSPAAFSFERAPGRILSVNRTQGDDGRQIVELQMQASVANMDTHNFDRDDIEAFILTYRMLTQNNDRYSVARLSDGYERVHEYFRDAFAYLREQNRLFLTAESPLQQSGSPISHRDLLDTVIYGELAHSNKQKAETFQSWTRWRNHEKALWLIFDHVLRCSTEMLRHFRDINAATLLLHFGVHVSDETTFKRLQEKDIFDRNAKFIPLADGG